MWLPKAATAGMYSSRRAIHLVALRARSLRSAFLRKGEAASAIAVKVPAMRGEFSLQPAMESVRKATGARIAANLRHAASRGIP